MIGFKLAMMVLAQAPAERLHVDWLAPEGCPDRLALRATLEETVPRDRTFSASVRIDEPREEGKLWRAVVITRLPEGQRTRVVEASDCARVTEAALLVVRLAATSIANEPTGHAVGSAGALLDGGAQPQVDPPADQDLLLDAGVDPPTDSRPERAPPPNLQLRLQALVGANLGLFPLPGLSAGLAVSVAPGPLRFELAAVQWVDSETIASRRGARFSLTSLKVKGCWLFPITEWSKLGPCVGGEGGALSATAIGVGSAQQKTTFWTSILTGATFGIVRSSVLRPWISLEVGANLVRPIFTVLVSDAAVAIHSVGWPVGRLTLGVELIFN